MNHIQEYFTFWRCASCPKCKKENWIYDSHSQRYYPYVSDGVKCHNCQNLFYVGDEFDFKIRYDSQLEDYGLEKTLEDYFDYKDGQVSPNG